jgi:hypothetical protein
MTFREVTAKRSRQASPRSARSFNTEAHMQRSAGKLAYNPQTVDLPIASEDDGYER